MKKIAFFDAKPYDKIWFEKLNKDYDFNILYFENKLNENTAILAKECDAVIAFVNDEINENTINELYRHGIKILAMRSAGYNNVDMKAARGKIKVVRVPDYSPHAVAEHTMALLLSINRKIHRAYSRTRDRNFSINGLIGYDLYGKTIGVIGTGKIGKTFIEICKGFGLNILAYDLYPSDELGVEYVTLGELFEKSDIISLHCPLTKDTYHIIDNKSINLMKRGVYIINTSRGALIDTEVLLDALKSGKVGAAALDVYEEESDFFFEDFSNSIINDDTLTVLTSLPNVLITSHQAFFTNEALEKIAYITLENLKSFFDGRSLENEVK